MLKADTSTFKRIFGLNQKGICLPKEIRKSKYSVCFKYHNAIGKDNPRMNVFITTHVDQWI